MKLNTVEEVFAHKVGMMLSAETQIADKGLPAMIEAASNPKLVAGFKMHQEETKGQIERLNQVIETCGIDRDGFMKCPITDTMITTTAKMIAASDKGAVRDVLLISLGQGVEHHEISSYGTLVELAKKLGHTQAAQLLEQTLEEEKATDLKLNELAINDVNEQALSRAAGTYTKQSAA